MSSSSYRLAILLNHLNINNNLHCNNVIVEQNSCSSSDKKQQEEIYYPIPIDAADKNFKGVDHHLELPCHE